MLAPNKILQQVNGYTHGFSCGRVSVLLSVAVSCALDSCRLAGYCLVRSELEEMSVEKPPRSRLGALHSLRSSSFALLTPAVRTSRAFVETAAPSSPARWRFSGQSSLN